MHLLYSIALSIALLVTLPWWLLRMARYGKYRAGLAQRLGRAPLALRETAVNEKCIWVHAVSVGEVLAVAATIERLKQKLAGWRIVVSTTTLAGHELACKRFGPVNVFYFPLDLSFALRPYFHLLRPQLVVVAETEFWPNFLRLAKASGARVAIVNARISDHSFPRYRSLRGLMERVLCNVDLFLAQSEQDKARLIAIGSDPGRIQVSGNLKFDATEAMRESSLAADVRAAIPADATIWICASTVEGEDELILDAFKILSREFRDLLLVLAPRHPERFDHVAGLIARRSLRFWRRSAWNGSPLNEGVFLLDTIGELASLFEIATIAFVGGSLVPRGGHNILEPAQFGVPTLVGPSTENFRDILELFERNQAVKRVDAVTLLPVMREWISNPQSARQLGARAQVIYRAQAGATERTVTALEVLLWMPGTIKARYEQVKG